MILGKKSNDSVNSIGKSTIKECEYEKILGIAFDKKLSFTKHAQDLCKKTNQKLIDYLIIKILNYIKTNNRCIHKTGRFTSEGQKPS